MEKLLFSLVMLASTTHAAETKRHGSQNTSLYSVALGESVYIQVLASASGHQVRCKKQTPSGLMDVFALKNEKLKISEAFRDRAEFFINNGTFKMTNVERNDSGLYIIEAFDPTGISVRKLDIQLDVQAAETKRHGSQNTSLYSVALGESVYIQVLASASGHQVRCKKQTPSGLMDVFALKNEKLKISEAFRDRAEFFINNGTFKMTNVERNDSGLYIIEAFDPTGISVRKLDIQLDVQEDTSFVVTPFSVQVEALLPQILIPIGIFTVLFIVCGIARRRYVMMKRNRNRT
ncbi:uncharacterized protein LOC115050158 [Echeneis naucrates]|uniref:uncharacterized protein LOC115050158 n=1 Tax=Echeneis naucrates TaxID=173247 RepID=UPI001113D508|nr:uncharacterized protein LOC115050158 [Echeneis naucrates]XP_029368782.1 uncharacterized protein LOC115050158 [Echeneis naucrates]